MSGRGYAREADRVRRVKGIAGLAALALVGLLGLRAGLVPEEAAVRALVAGAAAYFVAWWGAIHVVRMIAEAEAHTERKAAQEATEELERIVNEEQARLAAQAPGPEQDPAFEGLGAAPAGAGSSG